MMDEPLEFLQSWYRSKCDGQWEQRHGIEIGTLDNPGWYLKISGASGRHTIEVERETSESDWTHIHADSTEFDGACGAANFNELLEYSRKWLEASGLRVPAAIPMS